jgi:tetratricopeptide (TPR) repeat protein
MSAREIKEELAEAGVDFSDCFEKRDLAVRLEKHRLTVTEENVQEVKALANNAFSRAAYALAIRYYTEALALCEHDGNLQRAGSALREVAAQLRSNRAIALLKMEQVQLARRDAEACTCTAPWFAKGYLRLASAAARQRDALSSARACLRGMRLLATNEPAAVGGGRSGGAHTGTHTADAAAGPELEGQKAAPHATSLSPDDKLHAEFDALLQTQLAKLGVSEDSLLASLGLEEAEEGEAEAARGEGKGAAAEPGTQAHASWCMLLEILSEDVVSDLLGRFLLPAEVCVLAQTCRQLRALCVFGDKAAKMWQAVSLRCFPPPPTAHLRGSLNVRRWMGGRTEETGGKGVGEEGVWRGGVEMDWRSYCWERKKVEERWQFGLTQSQVNHQPTP